MIVKNILTWFYQRMIKLIRLEKDSAKLAFGSSLGIYIAFSPFIGFHTAMVILFSWLFSLNIAVLFTVSVLINNPGTMVPVYGLGYWFGNWLLAFIGVDHYAFNPGWISSCNAWLQHYVAVKGFSFWAFMLGGNVLGILLALLSYPLIKWLLRTISVKGKQQVLRTVARSKRAVNSLTMRTKPVLQRLAQKSRIKDRQWNENNCTK